MAAERGPNDGRVVLLAPTTRDADTSRRLLASAGIPCALCADLETLCRLITEGAAAAILPEETVLADATNRLAQCVRQQPVWSDLPVIVLSRAGAESPAVEKALGTLGNVSLVERPVRVSTLMSVIRSALRARERQYQARDYFAEQQRAAEAVRAARDEAEAANRAKDQFLAVLSHELRTPLSPVVMTIGAMEDDPDLPPRLREDVAMVRRNIDLETKLIDDLLDVSRVITGKLRLRAEQVALHDVLRHVLEVCEMDRASKRLEVVTELRAAADRVTGDPARLEQVFWNLLKNAIKFTPEGRRIVVRTANPEGGRVRVEVVDHGVGIDPTALPRLFNAFEQGNAAVTHQFGGLGLGLAISKAVVDLHGGTIRAESSGPGAGSTFVVELAGSVPAADGEQPPTASKSSNGRKPRVLLVEDHADTAKALSRLLKNSGYPVTTAATVADALQLADAHPFDLVVSDIGLPDATGYDLMRTLRDRHGIKGIALSGYGLDEDMRRSREAGFLDHLTKPINLPQLEAVIHRVIEPCPPHED
jgi:signal transduction histidine kinase